MRTVKTTHQAQKFGIANGQIPDPKVFLRYFNIAGGLIDEIRVRVQVFEPRKLDDQYNEGCD
ncbi:MAG: hypothetical protein J7621_18000 [Niastella sp.]|nr:hypothetical protein [Niastella sp.]